MNSGNVSIPNAYDQSPSRIEDTDASIVQEANAPKGRITKIAGVMGEEFIRLYCKPIASNVPYHLFPSLGVELSVSLQANHMTIAISDGLCPLYVGDYAIFHFEDESKIKVDFIVGSLKFGKQKRNYTILTDHQLSHMLSHLVSLLECCLIRSRRPSS